MGETAFPEIVYDQKVRLHKRATNSFQGPTESHR